MEANEIICIPVLSGGKWHFLPTDMLEAVVAGPVIVKVPEAPEEVMGLSVYEGQLVVYYVLDGQEEGCDVIKSPRCGIIIRTKNRQCAISADEISEQKTITVKEYTDRMTEQWKKILEE